MNLMGVSDSQIEAVSFGKEKPKAFAELRAMLMMHAADEVKAIGALGALEADELVRGVVERLRERIGSRLGNRPAA